MSAVHPTAIVDPSSRIGEDVAVGPYAVIEADVVIGDRCRIDAHAVVGKGTTLGPDNKIYSFASVGSPPQDLKYDGEPTTLEVGANNTIREFATLNRGTVGGLGTTRVGSNNLLMAYAHVAHDCIVGDSVVMANAATLGGHVTIEDYAIVGGLVAVHQNCRVGESAILGGGAMVVLDIPPYCMAAGDRARLHGLNTVGLKRRGMSAKTIENLRAAYRTLFRSGLRLQQAVENLQAQYADCPEVLRFARFVTETERGICR